MATVTIRGLDRIQPHLDLLTSGYCDTHNFHIIRAFHSWGEGIGSRFPETQALGSGFVRVAKQLGGDGGTYLPAEFDKAVWDNTATAGYDNLGLRNFFCSDYRIVKGPTNASVYPYNTYGAEKGSFASAKVNSWMSTGGFGAQYVSLSQTHAERVDSTYTYAAYVKVAGIQYALAGTTAASRSTNGSEPAGFAAGAASVNDNDYYWFKMGTGGAAWQSDTNYALNAKITSGANNYTLIGGKTTTLASITMNPIPGGLTDDGGVVWMTGSPASLDFHLPLGKKYRLVYTKDSGNGIFSANIAPSQVGYPITNINASNATPLYTQSYDLPMCSDLSYRTLSLTRVSGTPKFEGVLTMPDDSNSGVIDWNIAFGGRSLAAIYQINATAALQDSFVGKALINNAEPVMVALCYDINDYGTVNPAGAQTSRENAILYAKAIIKYYTNAYTNVCFLWIIPPPYTAGGAPAVGDAQYDYHQAVADGVYDATTAAGVQANVAIVDCSQAFGGITAAAAKTAGLYCSDGVHPTEKGYAIIDAAINEALGLDVASVLPAAPDDFTDTQKAAIATAVEAALASSELPAIADDTAKVADYLLLGHVTPIQSGDETFTDRNGTAYRWKIQNDLTKVTKTPL